MVSKSRPTKEEVLLAKGKAVPDVIGHGLQILFCGINPGLYSAAVRHHFARPGNRFWPALFLSGFTQRLLAPFEERHLLELGYGITNIVNRATASAAELSSQEFTKGSKTLRAKVLRYRPRCLAVLGIGAYRTAFGCREAKLGLQHERIGSCQLWVLPNPSGLNAHYRSDDLARLFGELRISMQSR